MNCLKNGDNWDRCVEFVVLRLFFFSFFRFLHIFVIFVFCGINNKKDKKIVENNTTWEIQSMVFYNRVIIFSMVLVYNTNFVEKMILITIIEWQKRRMTFVTQSWKKRTQKYHFGETKIESNWISQQIKSIQ